MTTYAAIYEPASDGSWSGRAADLPVYAVGDSRAEAERELRSAIVLYLEHLEASGHPRPGSVSAVGNVTV